MMEDMMNNSEDYIDSHESVEDYLQIFLNKYNAESIDEVNCVDVSKTDLELLGDVVMEQNHPGDAHVAMDAMMGEEGFGQLEQMHINMGKSYLGCNSEDAKEVENMQFIMGGDRTGWSGMSMFNVTFGYLWGVNSILFSVLLIVLIRYFWKKTN